MPHTLPPKYEQGCGGPAEEDKSEGKRERKAGERNNMPAVGMALSSLVP